MTAAGGDETCPWCTRLPRPAGPVVCRCLTWCGAEDCRRRTPGDTLCPGPRDEGHGRVVRGEPVWCRPCQASIVDALRRIPPAATRLTPGRLAAAAGDTDRTRHATTAGSPSLSPAFDELDAVTRWVAGCVDRLRIRLGHSPGRYQGRHVAEATYLVAHATAWLCTPDAGDDGRQALRWARRLEAVTGTAETVTRLDLPCPLCRCLALTRRNGEDWVTCRGCGGGWDMDRLTQLVDAVAAAMGRRR